MARLSESAKQGASLPRLDAQSKRREPLSWHYSGNDPHREEKASVLDGT